ncbi:hypothetical protein Plhal304r1_c033g0104851 [Plasmopara halstedii]
MEHTMTECRSRGQQYMPSKITSIIGLDRTRLLVITGLDAVKVIIRYENATGRHFQAVRGIMALSVRQLMLRAQLLKNPFLYYSDKKRDGHELGHI